MEDIIKRISIRGRFAFCLACLHNSLIKEGIDAQKLRILLDRLHDFLSSVKLSVWETKAVEVSPDTLLDIHADNDLGAYKTLSKEEAEYLKNMYTTLPKAIVQLIDLTISVGLSNLYGGTGEYSSHTLEPVLQVVDVMEQSGYQMPDISAYERYRFAEDHGWGNPQAHYVV